MRPIDGDKYKAILERFATHLENLHHPRLAEVARTAAKGLNMMPTITVEEKQPRSDCDDCGKLPDCEHHKRRPGIIRINCPLWRPKK